MTDFEKLGVFYLGAVKGKGTDGEMVPVLYKSNHLTTHGVIVGMTGSGKTGLAIDLIEEAAIDGIPSILIDPKGDLADIVLQFPDLSPGDFLPYVTDDDARREGLDKSALAAKTAETWKQGLAKWSENGERIKMLGESAEFSVYTPGDTQGRPLQLLGAYNAPRDADESTIRELVINSVAGLLGLAGIDGDPVQSREHILLSSIFYHEWKAGRDLDLPTIINHVITPPFGSIGVFAVDTFYPQKDRTKLAMALNGLVASPSFAAWREGEPLDFGALLWTPSGKPRVSVLSIAHLSDSERMFFTTAVLNAAISWMRRQRGTSSLRAMLYMDEIFGYFPPNGNPPSKRPMLTLLKQARAFGLGILLSTQNPVDLDYKGLSNCGTWFIGRLQTERDKKRILDGLESAAADAGGKFDRASIDSLLSGLGKRVFLLRDAAENEPILFETRWTLSYLAGPLSSAQIHALGGKSVESPEFGGTLDAMPSPFDIDAGASGGTMPSPFDVAEAHFVAAGQSETASTVAQSSSFAGMPRVAHASVRVHFVDAKSGVDMWTSRTLSAHAVNGGTIDWFGAEFSEDPLPQENAGRSFVDPKIKQQWTKEIASHVYQDLTLTLWRDPIGKQYSRIGESEADFRLRAAQASRERRDAAVAKLEAAYALKCQRQDDKVRAAENKVVREKNMASQKLQSTSIWAAIAAIGIFGGGRKGLGGLGRIGSTARGASAYGKKRADVNIAENSLEVQRERRKELDLQYAEELAAIEPAQSPETIALDEVRIRPRKADITVERIEA